MVTSITSFSRSGLSDWFIQRVSAVILAAYTIFIVAYIFLSPNLNYEQWQSLFQQLWMRVFSLFALLSVAVHAWIGLWAVLTDYVTERMMGAKALYLRVFFQLVIALTTLAYLVWGVEILWGL